VLIGGRPIGLSDFLTVPPYQFQIPVLPETPSGPYSVVAVGFVADSGDRVSSTSVTIQIERPDIPDSLEPVLPTLDLDRVSSNVPLDVM
jgi:hypothetical protein